MSKLFISHSTEDKQIVDQLLDFIVLGMGVPRQDVFCTSQQGALHSGDCFVPVIRKAMAGCEQVLLLITKNYLKSPFCLAELGAAWVMNGNVLPLLDETVQHEDLKRTPLLGVQTRSLGSKDDIFAIYDEFCEAGIVAMRSSVELNRRLPGFLSSIKNEMNSTQILHADVNGHYVTKIEAVRNVPQIYRCYRIKGLVDHIKSPVSGESHWIFYQENVYPDLMIGDTVEFSISKSELRQFPDLPNARNIYPAELFKR